MLEFPDPGINRLEIPEHTTVQLIKILVSIQQQSQFSRDKIKREIINVTSDVLVATSSWVAGASAKNPVAAALPNKIENMNDDEGEIGSSLKNVVHFYMMDIKEVDNATFNLSGDPGCFTRWDYSSVYLTLLICFVTVGLTASLFVLTVIGWFPDLYSTSKYICQAYSLLTNMVALVMAGFVVLSTFVPTINACNMVLALVHLTLFLFLTSELLIHLDFYSAIVRPFWHEESIASNENAVTFVVGLAALGSVGAVGGLFYTGHIRCNKDLTCPIVPIVNLSQNKETSMSVAVMTVALFGLVFLTCCHIFLIALQKLRANTVVPAAANNLSGTSKRLLIDNGSGVLMYEDDVVSKEVKSAARAPFADRDFLHAIGTTFLERVAKNATVPRSESGQIDVMMLDEPKPCSSREALKTTLTITHETHTLRRRTDTVRRYETKTTTARQLILKPPTEDELNKNFEKLRFVANETKEKPSSAGSPKTAISQENEKEKKPTASASVYIFELYHYKEDAQPININVELWKALTKSFKFTLLNIASYGFLLLPCSGLTMLALNYTEFGPIPFQEQTFEEYSQDPTGQVFLPDILWKTTILFFVMIRTAQPIILAKMDKTINNKIGVIISDDVED